MLPFDPEGLTGFQKMNPAWGIDWGRFIDIDQRSDGNSPIEKFRRLQFAYRIDTSLADPLSHLPHSVVSNPPSSLAERNLRRGYDLCLPSGQAVAQKMLADKVINEKDLLRDQHILIGKASPEDPGKKILDIDSSFHDNCPLWVYVLAEAMHNEEEESVTNRRPIKTPKLGPVGGRIVAEVILGLMFADADSVLNHQAWKPIAFHDPKKTTGDYTLADFVSYAAGDFATKADS